MSRIQNARGKGVVKGRLQIRFQRTARDSKGQRHVGWLWMGWLSGSGMIKQLPVLSPVERHEILESGILTSSALTRDIRTWCKEKRAPPIA